MSSTKKPSEGNQYEAIINDGIDELNSESNFEKTGFSEEHKEKKPTSKKTKSLITMLVALVALNVATALYLNSSAPSEALTQKKADAELHTKLAEQDVNVGEILQFVQTPSTTLPLPETAADGPEKLPIPSEVQYSKHKNADFYEFQESIK